MESDGLRARQCRKRIGHDPGHRQRAGEAFAVNGEDAMVTVLFVDLRGFTRFADSATARQAVALLNEFFGVVVPVLESHGTVKFKGKTAPVAVYAPEATR
jgi:class 3 adenylate cyclase